MTDSSAVRKRFSGGRGSAALMVGGLLLAGLALTDTRGWILPTDVPPAALLAAASTPPGRMAVLTYDRGLARFFRTGLGSPQPQPDVPGPDGSASDPYTGQGGPLIDEPTLFADTLVWVPSVFEQDIPDVPIGRRPAALPIGGSPGGNPPPIVTSRPTTPPRVAPPPTTPPPAMTPPAGPPTVSAVPEPMSWTMLIVGFGMIGGASRRRIRSAAADPLRS